MAPQSIRRFGWSRGARTLLSMKTLLKLALAGAITAVLVKWARQRIADGEIPTVNPAVGGGLVGDWTADAAEPMRGENLSVEPAETTTSPVTH